MIFAELFAVIVLWFAGLQVWDIATFHLAPALRTLRGALRLLAGCALAFGALALLYVWLPDYAMSAFSWLAICTFLAALAAEFLIGEDLRAKIRASLQR